MSDAVGQMLMSVDCCRRSMLPCVWTLVWRTESQLLVLETCLLFCAHMPLVWDLQGEPRTVYFDMTASLMQWMQTKWKSSLSFFLISLCQTRESPFQWVKQSPCDIFPLQRGLSGLRYLVDTLVPHVAAEKGLFFVSSWGRTPQSRPFLCLGKMFFIVSFFQSKCAEFVGELLTFAGLALTGGRALWPAMCILPSLVSRNGSVKTLLSVCYVLGLQNFTSQEPGVFA